MFVIGFFYHISIQNLCTTVKLKLKNALNQIPFFHINIGKGGSTLVCRPLITHLRNRAGLSTAGFSPFVLTMTAPAGFAIYWISFAFILFITFCLYSYLPTIQRRNDAAKKTMYAMMFVVDKVVLRIMS